MIYHNHIGSPLMVLGAPNPTDPRDDMMLIEEGANFDRRLSVYSRQSWVPIYQSLRRIAELSGNESASRLSAGLGYNGGDAPSNPPKA